MINKFLDQNHIFGSKDFLNNLDQLESSYELSYVFFLFVGLDFVENFPKDSFGVHFIGSFSSAKTSWKDFFVFFFDSVSQTLMQTHISELNGHGIEWCHFPTPIIF